MIRNLPKQKIFLLTISGLVAIFLLMIFLIIIPLIKKISLQSEELAQKKQTAENFYHNWQALAETKKEYFKIKESLKNEKLLLEQKETINFIEELESLSQKNNLEQEINLLDSDSDKKSLGLQINLYGEFNDIIKFLIFLENNSYLNEIQSLQITTFKDKKQNSNFSADTDKKSATQAIINLIIFQQ